MSTRPGFPTSFSILLTRMALSIWVGGAILFVITSVAEQVHPSFDSVIRDQLATIRFPHYYRFGGICLGVSLAGSLFAAVRCSGPVRKRMWIVFGLTLISTAIVVFDYMMVYEPLQTLITPPGKARTEEFLALHDRSRIVNEIHLTLALVACFLANWSKEA